MSLLYILIYIYNYIGIYDGNPSDTTDSKLEDPQVPTYMPMLLSCR